MWADERARNARWGESCMSYYQLDVEYFMSSASAALMGIVARDFMWTRVLSTTATLDSEARDRLPERIHRIAEKIDAAEVAASTGVNMGRLFGRGAGGAGAGSGAGAGGIGGSGPGGGGGPSGSRNAEIAEATLSAVDLATELVRGQGSQFVKLAVFEGRPIAETDAQALSNLALRLDAPVRTALPTAASAGTAQGGAGSTGGGAGASASASASNASAGAALA
jgi:hypothetical protein